MKTLLPLTAGILLGIQTYAQIITPQVKANFGVDADLRGNFVNTSAAAGNDDWFLNGGAGAGQFVIDTNGAAAIYNNYLTNLASRNLPFSRNMSYPPFSLVNNKTLIDAVFVRDYHGVDSTVFASGAKNGMNPTDWTTPVAQTVPDKNEILDVYMHVRRDGKFSTDSLWMFGAVSIENTTGNRYFDFEMFQSDIFYDRSRLRFTGNGPDAGHNAWQFDAAGSIIKTGDIILTAEYGSASLTMIEARIWVHRSALSINPQSFRWSGQFDGAGTSAQFGYASIVPKDEGAFYTGLQNTANVWGGSYGIVRGDNTITTDYTPSQFMEFSVNLTKLGLDPVTILGGSSCDMNFRRVMVKTRASTSFTSALKDFVAPFKPLNIPPVDLFTNIPMFCGVFGISNLRVLNPIPTSLYFWETLNGRFTDTSNKTSVYVDQPGTYIVHQRLGANCPIFSSDTLTISFSAVCGILLNKELGFRLSPQENIVQLNWNALQDDQVATYQLERSEDGIHFQLLVSKVAGVERKFVTNDMLSGFSAAVAFYRLRIKYRDGNEKFSESLRINLQQTNIRNSVMIMPNPVIDVMQLRVQSASRQTARFVTLNSAGTIIQSFSREIERGTTNIVIAELAHHPPGIYTLRSIMNNEVLNQRFILK